MVHYIIKLCAYFKRFRAAFAMNDACGVPDENWATASHTIGAQREVKRGSLRGLGLRTITSLCGLDLLKLPPGAGGLV